MNKKFLSAAIVALTMSGLWGGYAHAETNTNLPHDRSMTVFKSPTCGCCAAWVEIMSRAGFKIEVRDMEDLNSIKRMAAIPEPFWACHSAKLGRYIIEGHVPVEAVEKLLAEQPALRGIAVPGMPVGAPGMGSDPQTNLDVLVIGNSAQDANNVYMRVGG